MDKLELAKQLLEQIKMPAKQQSTLCCLTLLAMAKLKKDTPCYQATNDWIRIHDVIVFIADNYGVIYAENSISQEHLYGDGIKNTMEQKKV